MTASIISAPAALAIAKIMVPETEVPVTTGEIELNYEKMDINGIDAISRGTLEGLRLALNIGAMLIVFVAIIAMVNGLLGMLGGLVGLELSLQILDAGDVEPRLVDDVFVRGPKAQECRAGRRHPQR